MKQNYSYLIAICFSAIGNLNCQGQSLSSFVLNTTGSSSETLTSSVGESFASVNSTNLNEGFIQSYFEVITSFTDLGKFIDLVVYPNPVADHFSIGQEIGSIEWVKAFNQNGQEVHYTTLGSFEVDVKHLSEGLYTIFIKTKSNNLFTSKILKQQ